MVPIKPGVLLLTPFFHPNIGGVETHLTDLCQVLSKRNFRVFVHTYSPLTNDTAYLKNETIGNIRIFRYPWIGSGLFHRLEKFPLLDFLYLTPYLFFRTFLWLLANRRSVSLIHAQGLNASLIGLILKLIFGLRLVTSIHAVYETKPDSLTSRLNSFILNQNDHVLTLSKVSQKELISFGVAKNKISLFRYWINLNLFRPQTHKPNSKFTILFVGRLIPKKGVRLLVDVARQLPDCQFIFVGTGPDSAFLHQASGLYPNLKFFGQINNDKLPPIYNLADVFCIPSLYQEGFGRVVMEAVACGLPIIGSNKGGIPEALSSQVSLLTPPSVESIISIIKKLKKDSALYLSLKKNCRSYARKHFSENNINDIIKFYQ